MTGTFMSAGQADSSPAEPEVADGSDRGAGGVNGNDVAEQGGKAGSHISADSSRRTYWEDRQKHLRRGRLVGFSLCIPLWALSMVPVARESMEGREGVLVYLTVAAISLGVAAVIRGVYVLLTKRRFLSPWIFVMAAFVAIVGSAVQGAGEVPVADISALESSGE
jgi:hypothetical protein